MNDSKKKSITESISNIIVGFPISYLSNLVILPYYDVHQNLYFNTAMIGVWFTIISIVRSYFLRRLFNRLGKDANALTALQWCYNKIKII